MSRLLIIIFGISNFDLSIIGKEILKDRKVSSMARTLSCQQKKLNLNKYKIMRIQKKIHI